MINLLIVEDDKDQIELYTDALDEINELGYEICPHICKSYEEGIESILTGFDAAIVDLRLSAADIEASGNKIVKAIVKGARYPIYVVSGNIQDLDPDITENRFVVPITRDVPKKAILEDIVKTYETGITELLGNRGLIETWINKVFWEHLVVTMEHWKNSASSKVDTKKSMLRYCILHLTEYLNQDNEGIDEVYSPAEAYIMPPIKSCVSAGDIVKSKTDEQLHILLTPPCDTVCRTPGDTSSRRARKFLLADIKKITDLSDVSAKVKNSSSRRALIEGYCKNNKRIEYHFLPKFMTIPPSVIDFQELKSVDCDTFDDCYDRIGTVSLPFYKDIMARFSAYYARQGQPDFDFEVLASEIDAV